MIKKIRSSTRGFFFYPTWSIPIALLALTLLSYGIRALSLGFFWDDWPYLWFFERFGPQGIIDAFSGDRPFLSFIYITTLSLFGHSTQAWQAFALLAHWLYGLGFWLMLAAAWPRKTHQTAFAAFLFAVYPGFTGHWISVIYGQAFLLFSFVFFSISLTLWLARRRGRLVWGWQAAGAVMALLLSGFTMYSTEYFFGVELLRPVLLWVVLADAPDRPLQRGFAWLRDQAVRVALWWAPYLALMISFAVWRGLLQPMQGYQLSTLQGVEESPLSTLIGLGVTVAGDVIEASLAAWGQTMQLSGILEVNRGAGLRWLLVTLLTAALVVFYLVRLCPREGETGDSQPPMRSKGWRWPVEAIGVGVLALLVSGLPFWITGLPMRMGFPQDRFSMMLSIGVCLVLAGLIDAFARDLPRKAVLVGLLAALAVGFHFNTSRTYQEDRAKAREFFWQLTWRAPQLKENTLLVTSEMPFRYFEDDSLTAPLNWTYDPDGREREMRYMLYDLVVRQDSLGPLKPGQAVNKDFRATQFQGSTSEVVAFYYGPTGCLKVLDPAYDTDLNLLPEHILRALPLSNPSQQILDSDQPADPPQDLFGAEPKHTWCYFYQKAELARQNQDWEAILHLKRQSIGEGYRPEDPAEYLPFIEGYARLLLVDDAYELTTAAYRYTHTLRPALCAVWQRAIPDEETASQASAQTIEKASSLLNCPIPQSRSR